MTASGQAKPFNLLSISGIAAFRAWVTTGGKTSLSGAHFMPAAYVGCTSPKEEENLSAAKSPYVWAGLPPYARQRNVSALDLKCPAQILPSHKAIFPPHLPSHNAPSRSEHNRAFREIPPRLRFPPPQASLRPNTVFSSSAAPSVVRSASISSNIPPPRRIANAPRGDSSSAKGRNLPPFPTKSSGLLEDC